MRVLGYRKVNFNRKTVPQLFHNIKIVSKCVVYLLCCADLQFVHFWPLAVRGFSFCVVAPHHLTTNFRFSFSVYSLYILLLLKKLAHHNSTASSFLITLNIYLHCRSLSPYLFFFPVTLNLILVFLSLLTSLSCCTFNTRSLLHQLLTSVALSGFIDHHHTDLIRLTESWIKTFYHFYRDAHCISPNLS